MVKTDKKNFFTKIGDYISETYRYNSFTMKAWGVVAATALTALVLSCTHQDKSNQNTTQVNVPQLTTTQSNTTNPKTIQLNTTQVPVPNPWDSTKELDKAISITNGDNSVQIIANDSSVVNYNPQIIIVDTGVQVQVPNLLTSSKNIVIVKQLKPNYSNVTLVPVPNPWTSKEAYKAKKPSNNYSGKATASHTTKQAKAVTPDTTSLPRKSGKSIDSTIISKPQVPTTGIEKKCLGIIPSANDSSLKRFELSEKEAAYKVADTSDCNYKNN